VGLEKSQGVGYPGTRSPQACRDRVLSEAEFVDQLAEGVRLLDRAEIGPLQILDKCELQLIAVGELANDGRDSLEPRKLSRPDAALPGDELITVERLRHENGLEDAVLPDARGELFDCLLVNRTSRLVRIPADAYDRDLGRRGDGGGSLRDERGKAPPEPGRRRCRMGGHRAPTTSATASPSRLPGDGAWLLSGRSKADDGRSSRLRTSAARAR